jgi:hypothetical protein
MQYHFVYGGAQALLAWARPADRKKHLDWRPQGMPSITLFEAPVQEIKNILINEFQRQNPDPLSNISDLQLGIHRWLIAQDVKFVGGIWNGEQRNDPILGLVLGVVGFIP